MSKIGIYTAASGVYACQNALDVTANNIANINTNGFKASRAAFSDLLYTKYNPNNDMVEQANGTRLSKTDMMFEQSTVRATERQLDFAALDECFFAVETKNGDTAYLKDGSFQLTQNTDGAWQLCDANGSFVLDDKGARITVPYDAEKDTYNLDGLADMIGTYKFANPYGLDQTGANYYSATASSGAAEAVPDATIKQGYLEASSTNIATEMSKVIEYKRAFQMNISMIKTHDEMNSMMNNLKN